jgi:hypothetical protein
MEKLLMNFVCGKPNYNYVGMYHDEDNNEIVYKIGNLQINKEF